MATFDFDWKQTDYPPFVRRCGHLRTPTQVSEDLKTPIKNWAILFFKNTEILGANWNSNPASSRLCTWRKAKSDRRNVLEDFSKIIEAILLDSMWPGTDPVKRVHACWEPALSFFYCTDLCYLNTWEILLMASVNTFYNRFY